MEEQADIFSYVACWWLKLGMERLSVGTGEWDVVLAVPVRGMAAAE